MKVGERTVVTMDYELKYTDGELIESSIELKQPMQFVYGKGQIVAALEKAILDKAAGDDIVVSLSPEEAYGKWEENALCNIPRSQFPADMEIEEGCMLTMESEDGRTMPFVIVKTEGDDVVVDFNHPLAGQELVFSVSIRDVREATLDEILKASSGCGNSDCGCDSKSKSGIITGCDCDSGSCGDKGCS
jgi:FKBP-type peptidyl-prolyl cis-trans isomerase SlyD